MDDLLDSHYQTQISTSSFPIFILYHVYNTIYMYTIIIHKTTLTLLIK